MVGLVFYVTYLAYNTRTDRNETVLQSFKRAWSSEEELNDVLVPPKAAPVIGTFTGQDWHPVDYVEVNDADNQDSLKEFMETVNPNIVGTM